MLGIEPVLTATVAALVVEVAADETAVAGTAVFVEAAVAFAADVLRGIAPSDADTLVFCCDACTAGTPLVVGRNGVADTDSALVRTGSDALATAALVVVLK